MILHQMLQKTCGDSTAEVFIRMPTPSTGKLPYQKWVTLDEFADINDGLPTGISSIIHYGLYG